MALDGNLQDRRVNHRGRVIAIELEPANFSLLGINVLINNLEAVTLVQGPAGDRDGTGVLHLSRLSNRHSMVAPLEGRYEQVEVEAFKVDTRANRLGLPHVDCVRMDLEGYEIEAVRGMMETLRKHRPILVMELHTDITGGRKIVELLQSLRSLGYKTEFVVSRYLDNPWIAERDRPRSEQEGIVELVHDPRIVVHEHPVNAIFVPESADVSVLTCRKRHEAVNTSPKGHHEEVPSESTSGSTARSNVGRPQARVEDGVVSDIRCGWDCNGGYCSSMMNRYPKHTDGRVGLDHGD